MLITFLPAALGTICAENFRLRNPMEMAPDIYYAFYQFTAILVSVRIYYKSI